MYDQTSTFLEYDGNGLQVAKYDYGSDRLISQTRASGTQFYSFDALRSVTNLTDTFGTLAASYHLDTWGNFRFPEEIEQSANRFGFTSHLFDAETNLYYAKARYYDGELGRFLTQDSFLGQIDVPPSLHRFTYVRNRPTVFVDPSGNIEVLQELRERLDKTKGNLIGAAEDLGNYVDERVRAPEVVRRAVKKRIGEAAGALAGITGVAEKAVGVVNLAANATVATVAPDSELALQAGRETDEFIESATDAIQRAGAALSHAAQVIREDPGAAGGAALDFAQEGAKRSFEHVVRLAEGDPRATAQAVAFGTELAADIVIGGKGAGAGRGLLQSVGRQVDDLAEVAGRGLREGAEHLPLRFSVDPGSNLGNLRLRGAGERLRIRGPDAGRRGVGQQQGREFRIESLELNEFDPKLPRHVRGWLSQERRRVELGQADAPRNPPGYVQAHGRDTPAREGFDYSNSRLQNEELNKLEERVRRREGRQ